jgi:hypothetical protein
MSDNKIKNGIFSVSFLATVGIILSILPFVVSYCLRTSGYEWIVTAVSWEIALWSLVGSFAYHRSKSFYLTINRLFSFFLRSHSYWLPSFRFFIPDDLLETDNIDFLQKLLDSIQREKIATHFSRVNLINPQKAEIILKKGERYVLEFDNVSLFVGSDRALTMPIGLYEKKSRFLSDFADKIRLLANAVSVTSEIQIQFEDNKNPYYGFFVNTIPNDLLDSFDVSFRTDMESECSIVANESGIIIKGKNLLHTFLALKNILSLQPITASL